MLGARSAAHGRYLNDRDDRARGMSQGGEVLPQALESIEQAAGFLRERAAEGLWSHEFRG